jgi:DNA adenine methylase
LSSQSFASIIDNAWGYDKTKNTTTKKNSNKRDSFTEEYAIRLQNVQIECTDALRIINSRDRDDAFFYCDPPYYNSNCGHYDGYTIDDFERLLTTLSKIKGKFLLSSYPSEILSRYVKDFNWHQKSIELTVSVANNTSKDRKKKIEVFTANYSI